MSLADREHLPKVVTDIDGIRDILLALDPEIVLLREDISQLIKELYVSTTEKYIDRWEQDFSLPYDSSLTLEQRRQRVKNKLARKKVLNWQNLRLLIKNNIVKPRFYIVNEAENYHFKIFLEQQPQRQEFDLSKFTVVGSPTITDDGVASGFSKGSDYITANLNIANYTSLNVRSKFNYKVNSSENGMVYWMNGNTFRNYVAPTGSIQFYADSLGLIAGYPASNFKEGDNIETNCTITKDLITIEVIVNGIALGTITKPNTSDLINSTLIGIGSSYYQGNNPYAGTIDLKQFSITVDGKEVFSGIKNIDYITNELRTSLNQAKPAYLTYDIIVTEFFTRYCGTFSSGTEPL